MRVKQSSNRITVTVTELIYLPPLAIALLWIQLAVEALFQVVQETAIPDRPAGHLGTA